MTWHRSSHPARHALLAAIFALLSSTGLFAQMPWLPVPPEDLALKDNPALPGSSAMILYKEDTLDHEKNDREVYYRIKIFTEEGRKYGDIQIPYRRGKMEVKDLAARTIQPDGQITEFRGVVYDKTIIRAGKFRVQAKVITLPDVQPGTIIEYQYRLDGGGRETDWPVQETLFVRAARLTLRPDDSFYFPSIIARPAGFDANFATNDDGELWTTLSNLPPFEREVWMPPEAQARMTYHVSYPGLTWYKVGEELAKASADFVKEKDLRQIVRPLISPSDSPEEKLRKLYTAVQTKIRNLSYEERYSKKELKREQMKERKSARDVWNYGYGTSGEITLLFVGLCRAAGFTCDPVYASGRDTHFFDEELLDPSQLSELLAAVDFPGGFEAAGIPSSAPRFFDPGTRFAPFGLLSWEKQGVAGFRVREKKSERINTPPPQAEETVRHRRVTIELQPDGAAQVRAEIRLAGQEAIARREELAEFSDPQREQAIRDEFEEDFPAAELKQVSWDGLEGPSGEVELTYTFEIPSYAIPVGSALVVRPTLVPYRSPLPNWKRKYSVYFPYPYTRTDEVRIVPPPGFQLEQLPEEENSSTPNGQFEFQVTNDGNAVTVQRKLAVQEILYNGADAFRQAKSFFDKVQASDQKQLVFRQP